MLENVPDNAGTLKQELHACQVELITEVCTTTGEAIAARQARSPGEVGRIHARLIARRERLDFEIEDNGVGLPAKDRDRLTEPYVTTREKGTGLGLAIVERILEDHGGQLTMTDARDKPGALVVLSFPYSHSAQRAPQAVVESV